MKIKTLTIAAFCVFAMNAMAQDLTSIPNLDLEEDTADVTTISDIVKMQQKVLSNTSSDEHYTDVWRRRSYFNISKNSAKLTSDAAVTTEDGKKDLSFKSDWGVSIQSGTNYRLHKKPIENKVSIALDYQWLDLSVNHFKKNKDANGYCYDSSLENGSYYYYPWNLEKYEADYGMCLGPSITVAPFIPLENKALDHIRIQAYYHIGYSASLLYTLNDKKCDVNTANDTDHEQMSNNLKLQWGTGMFSTFGVSLMWKGIGFGFEHRSGSFKYKNINTDDFGKDKNKFKQGVSRIYITFRT